MQYFTINLYTVIRTYIIEGVKNLTDTEFESGIKLILEGKKDALRKIYDAYSRMIYQVMLNIVKNPQDAEDLTSDFFLKLWDTAGQYAFGGGHKRYITVMARNLAFDFLRKQKFETYTLDDDTCEHAEQEDSMRVDDDVIGGISFDRVLSNLKDDEREIISLHLGMELTFSEISKVLDKPLGTVAWKYRQAISKLRKTVKEGGING